MAGSVPAMTNGTVPSGSEMARLSGGYLLVVAVLLLVGGCSEPAAPPARTPGPTGAREPLHAGDWQGAMGGTMIDFRVDRVQSAEVDVRISGNVINPSPQLPVMQRYFYDRPKACTRRPDGRTFDCPHYADMHIDNGLLCGTYVRESQMFRPCFQPVQ
jgi:hypothetical protein